MQKLLIVILSTLVMALSFVVYGQSKSEAADTLDFRTLPDRVFHTDQLTVTIQQKAYIRMKFAVETDSKKTRAELEKAYPLIENKLIHYLSSLDKQTVQTINGIESIEAAIKKELSHFVATGEVMNVYVTEKIVQ